jgi:acyl-CoA synthetase (AMP-forming)/AMP-acid ligase II
LLFLEQRGDLRVYRLGRIRFARVASAVLTGRPRPWLGFVDGWDEHADRPALVTVREVVTYAELAARVAAEMELFGCARRLVLIELQNSVPAITSYLAALRAGHVVLVASDRGTRESLVERYDPDVVAGPHADDAWQVVERRAGTRHDLHSDLALLLSTSASTGSPKLVRLSYENLDSNAKSIGEYLNIEVTDRAMTSLPLSYCYGLSVLHSHLARGAAVIVTGLSVVDSDFWTLARSRGATAFAGVPYTFELLDRFGFADLELPSLRYITQAGGKLDAAVVERFAELGHRRGWGLVVMYGQTEATARMAYLPADRVLDAPQAVGVPIPGGRFTIDDEGELIYRGPNVMLGYARAPEDLALGRTIDHLCTGDIARHRPDGLYEIVGRRSRFLKLFGLRVDLDQLEQELRSDGIQALCTGDDTGLVVAVTKKAPELSAAICAKVGLPPSAVHTVALAELPRNVNGKPDYAAVVRSAIPSPDSATQGVVQVDGVHALYRKLLRADEIRATDTFVSLGGDSLTFVETSYQLERLLGTLPPDWHLMTVAQLEARPKGTPRGPFTWMESSVVLRAVAIVLICSNHYISTTLWGGAHILLAVAGFSFARFQVTAVTASGRVRPLVRSIVRIAVPAAIVIGIAYVLTDTYDIWNVLLVHTLVSQDYKSGWTPRWNYWFVEVLVAILVVWTALLLIPAVRRLERAKPFRFALAFLVIALAFRLEPLVAEVSMHDVHPLMVWLFALGWAAARATRNIQRLLLSAAAVCGVMLPGFSDGPNGRESLVVGGVLLLIWVTRVPMLVALQRLTGLLAGASLWIYLTNFPMYPVITWVEINLLGLPSAGAGQSGWPLAVHLAAYTAIALAVGVLAWKAYEHVVGRLTRLRTSNATVTASGEPLP